VETKDSKGEKNTNCGYYYEKNGRFFTSSDISDGRKEQKERKNSIFWSVDNLI
jgi:hypothetical protein